jgi:hypothetical protein
VNASRRSFNRTMGALGALTAGLPHRQGTFDHPHAEHST